MTQLPKETQKNGDTNKSKGTDEYAKHKRRLNMKKNTLGPTKTSILSANHSYIVNLVIYRNIILN